MTCMQVYYELLIRRHGLYGSELFNEDYEYDHWYFSLSQACMQYYRLIRNTWSLHSMNPSRQNASTSKKPKKCVSV